MAPAKFYLVGKITWHIAENSSRMKVTLSPKPQGYLLVRAGTIVYVDNTRWLFGSSQADMVLVRVLQKTEPTDNLA